MTESSYIHLRGCGIIHLAYIHFLFSAKQFALSDKNQTKLPLTKNTAKARCFLLTERQKGAKPGSARIAENHILLQEKHSDFEL